MENTTNPAPKSHAYIVAELVDEWMTAGLRAPSYGRMIRSARRLANDYGRSITEVLAETADNLGHDGDAIRAKAA